jgi:signal transduction histidine kinase
MDVKQSSPQAEQPKSAPLTGKTPLMRDYWQHYRRSAIIGTILMQLVVTAVVGMSLLVAGLPLLSPGFWITLLATLLTAGSLNIVLFSHLLTPHRDVITAITSAAGEEPRLPLPNPNTVRYTRNGFKSILQFVYESAAKSNSSNVATSGEGSADLTRLSTAFNQTKAGIIVMDADGVIQYANKKAPVSYDTNNKPQLELLFDTDSSFSDWLANCRESSVHAEKTWLRVPDKIVGEENRRIFNITANYEKGTAAEVVLVLFDSTSYYQPEDDELDFIAFAAHELRGPITVIRGYLDVLDIEIADQLAPDQRELIKRLIVSANRLSGYINNILNTSKYDRRHLIVHLAEESLASIYDSIRDDMELRASSQNRLLSVDLPADLPTVAADRSSLSEVISNLIDNALKYSNEGGAVALSASTKDNYVVVSVKDNGIGMPGNVVGNLFHKFYRSHRSRETVAGTGIGLYICKAIVESHGGQIGVSSVEGQGSTFTFTVPTYASVAEKLQANDHTNAGLITNSDGWIKNHAMYKS